MVRLTKFYDTLEFSPSAEKFIDAYIRYLNPWARELKVSAHMRYSLIHMWYTDKVHELIGEDIVTHRFDDLTIDGKYKIFKYNPKLYRIEKIYPSNPITPSILFKWNRLRSLYYPLPTIRKAIEVPRTRDYRLIYKDGIINHFEVYCEPLPRVINAAEKEWMLLSSSYRGFYGNKMVKI